MPGPITEGCGVDAIKTASQASLWFDEKLDVIDGLAAKSAYERELCGGARCLPVRKTHAGVPGRPRRHARGVRVALRAESGLVREEDFAFHVDGEDRVLRALDCSG